jgi:hypothetical protein
MIYCLFEFFECKSAFCVLDGMLDCFRRVRASTRELCFVLVAVIGYILSRDEYSKP